MTESDMPSTAYLPCAPVAATLAESEAQLRALVAASSDVIYRMSPDWSEMRQLDGRGFLADATAPTILWWEEYIFPEDRPRIQAIIDEAIRTKGVFALEHRVRRADGSPGWTFSRAIPVLDADGEIADWFGAAQDITARRESEDRYRSLFETMGQGYCDLRLLRDEQGRAVDQLYLELNPAYERLIGIPVAEAKGRKASEVMPDLEPWWTETFDRIANEGAPERIEHEVVSIGRWFEVYTYPRDRDHLTVLYEDITVRKRAEIALFESEERQGFLLALSDALRPIEDATLIQGKACEMLAKRFDVDRCYYVEVDESAGTAVVERDYVRDDAPSLAGSHPISDFAWSVAILRRNECHVVPDTRTSPAVPDEGREALGALQIVGCMGAPLIKGSRLVGALCVTTAKARSWTDEEVHLLRDVAERIWAAVQRARAEAALRHSQRLQTTMLEVVPLGLALLGTDGRAIVANPEFERFATGGRMPSLDAENVWRWRAWDGMGQPIAPDDFPGARALRGEHVTAGMEFLYTDETGREIWTNVASLPLIDDDDRVTGAVCIIQDIDEAKRAHEALRTSEERLRQFGEASQDILWIRDAETLQWTYLTPAFETVYGISREEALSGDSYRNWLDLIVPEDRDHAREMIRRVAEGEQVTYEFRIRRPTDGQIHWLRNTDFPIADDSGKFSMIGGIGHDATELREAELRFRTLIEGISQLVWRAVDSGEWTWASPQWTEFTGQAEPDSHDLGWLECVHPHDRDAALTAWSHAIEKGGFNVEYRLCDQRGEYSWFSTRAMPVRDDTGTIVEWLGTSTDINGLRQLQERQRILLAELQHRVRNIMAMIRSVARRTARGPATVIEYIEHFEGRINAMSRTQALLTRSPGAGVDLQNLVRDELEAQSARPQHYTCRGPDIALSPKAAEVLTLAVHELATNATKYGALGTPHGLVVVQWHREDRDGADWLRFEWTELRVTLPPDVGRRKGFGTELVTRRVPYELKGRGAMEFRPTGLYAMIEFPLVPGQSILQTDADVSDGHVVGELA